MNAQPKPLPSVESLADMFYEVLLEQIGASGIALVRQRNAVEKDPLICHSHDFCDANEMMAEAFASFLGEEDPRLESLIENDTMVALWNAAWSRFKQDLQKVGTFVVTMQAHNRLYFLTEGREWHCDIGDPAHDAKLWRTAKFMTAEAALAALGRLKGQVYGVITIQVIGG